MRKSGRSRLSKSLLLLVVGLGLLLSSMLQQSFVFDGAGVQSFLVQAKEAEIQSTGETATDENDGDDDDNDNDDGSDDIVLQHFVAHNKTMTCSADEHARPFNNQIRGVNLGGFMVLEPWITPSMFYQFLGGDQNNSAFDMYTFCQTLGPQEANQQLRRHWETWVTEEIIQELADTGAVNSFRLPIGDFQFVPYGTCVYCFKCFRLFFDWSQCSLTLYDCIQNN